MSSGDDIVQAAKGLSETTLANIESNREKIKGKIQKLKQSKESQNYFIGNGLVRINMTDTYVLDHYLILEHGTIFHHHT